MGACVGVDLWNHDEGGKTLKRTTDFLAAYSGKLESWPHKELRPDASELDELLRRAGRAWPQAGYPVSKNAELRRFMKAGSSPDDLDVPK
jgi:hypothetical protein